MTTLLAALAIGALSSAVVWALAADVFGHPTLARRNVRGLEVPTAGGIILVLAMLPGWAAVNLLVVETGRDVLSSEMAGAFQLLTAVALFAVLGLLDDVLARGDDRGFRGHLGALARGRLTTGGIKLLGGGVAALAIAAGGQGALWTVLLDAAVIALAANLANLFDRAPGRVSKVAVVALAGLVLAAEGTERHDLASVALVVGLALGLLRPELQERIMLGDTGANPLGAVLGIGLVATTGTAVTLVVLVVLVGLNLLSEKVSFSAVIDASPPLRWVDQLGRRPS